MYSTLTTEILLVVEAEQTLDKTDGRNKTNVMNVTLNETLNYYISVHNGRKTMYKTFF